MRCQGPVQCGDTDCERCYPDQKVRCSWCDEAPEEPMELIEYAGEIVCKKCVMEEEEVSIIDDLGREL